MFVNVKEAAMLFTVLVREGKRLQCAVEFNKFLIFCMKGHVLSQPWVRLKNGTRTLIAFGLIFGNAARQG